MDIKDDKDGIAFDRKTFEERAFNMRFLHSVKKVGNGQFSFRSINCPPKEEFIEQDEKGNYIDQTLSAMWWAWKQSRIQFIPASEPLSIERVAAHVKHCFSYNGGVPTKMTVEATIRDAVAEAMLNTHGHAVTEIVRLLREQKVVEDKLNTEMVEKSKQGWLWTNGQCAAWPEFQKVSHELQLALEKVKHGS